MQVRSQSRRSPVLLAILLASCAAQAGSEAPAEAAKPVTLPPRPGAEWVKPGDAELRARLSPLAYQVTQHEGTETAFHNHYWNNHQPGIYVDVVSGEPLFGARDKYESATGWPSFTRPLLPDAVVERTDRSLFYSGTEVRSKRADSHLGHVFNDGPAPTGLRYCMNSAALRFIPAADLERLGYGEFAEAAAIPGR